MSLVTFQRTLLTLYSNKRDLERFLEDESYYPIDGLSEREKKALRGIPPLQLKKFQRLLHQKNIGIARKIVAAGDRVALTVLHPKGPSLIWGSPSHIESFQLTDEAYRLLHHLSRIKAPLTIQSLIKMRGENHHVSAGDLFKLVSLMYSKKIVGANIRVPLVL